MEQDPIKYNYLLYLWNEISNAITHGTDPVTYEIVKMEEDIKRQVRQQVMIDKMKKSFGVNIK